MNSRMFKWSVVLTSTLISSIPVSVNAQVIYGLENAHHFTSHQAGPYFVQIASFRSASSAHKLKQQLASRSHYPVQVRVLGKIHTVRIGPISSVAEVRSLQTGQPTTRKRVTQPQHKTVNAKVIKQSHVPRIDAASQHSVIASGNNQHWYVGMNAGFMQTHMSKSNMTVPNGSDYPAPLNVDQFSLKNHHPVMIDIQAGHRWTRAQQFIPAYSLALRYQHVFTKNIQGTVTEYSLPQFENYNYRWGIGADALSLYSKIDLIKYARMMPYVDVGLGISSTRSKNYSETALSNVTPRFNPDFAAKRNAQFTYNLGAGVDFILTQKLLLSAGYEYQSFGNASSGIGQGPNWHSTKLNLGKFNSNMGIVGLTYLFDGSEQASHQLYK